MRPHRNVYVLLLLAAVLAMPAPAGADEGDTTSTAAEGGASWAESWPPGGMPVFELPDTVMVEARRYGYGPRQVELLYDYFRSDAPDTLAPHASRFALRPGTRVLSRFGCVAYGADRGANTALFLGGIGNMFGLWDEKTALAVMGAGAALGAIWGGTIGSKDSNFRIRIDTDR